MNAKLKIALCGLLLMQAVNANPISSTSTKDSETEKINLNTQSTTPTQDDILLRQKTIKPEQVLMIEPTNPISDDYLLSQPQTLEKILAVNLASNHIDGLERIARLYAQLPNRDESLIEWANALLLARKNLPQAISDYRVLLSKFPNNHFIRFQLATLLFQNQEFDAAKVQFEKLRAVPTLNQQDMAVFDAYLTAIARKDKWGFNLGASFLNDKNLTEMADVGTQFVLPNGGSFTQNSEHEKGTGINLNVGADKRWSLKKGQYIGLSTSANLKYYWNNHAFNELGTYVGLSYGYNNARVDVKATPYVFKRFYAGGDPSSDSKKLHAYTNTLGVTLSSAVWLTPNLKQFASYTYGRESYNSNRLDARYGGANHTVSTSLMYLRGAKQYFGGGVDVSRRNAGDGVNAYKRYGGRLFWGQEWPLGFSTTTNVGFAKRLYDDPWLGIVRRNNKEWNASASVWHKAVHFKGITPRLTLTYQKTKSNIPIYSYDKKLLFVELEKSF